MKGEERKSYILSKDEEKICDKIDLLMINIIGKLEIKGNFLNPVKSSSKNLDWNIPNSRMLEAIALKLRAREVCPASMKVVLEILACLVTHRK